ncbi:MAG TPA: hypothetical protein VGR32_05490 [Brevundimonas sp.]|jgi:Flp pilus assembly protein TadD|uniref:hypothetical protein n=1 Tax=Brevundimonas sp. TaxID=1871086 RepID=UPI002DED1F7A|nr:hypothetical protein [Brevundimonas sp.]
MTRLFGALIGAVAIAMCAGQASAQTWLRAESEHFIIYSDGGERTLRDYAVKLERFDQILRLRFGVAPDKPTLRKLPIYLVARQAGLEEVWPGVGSGVAGFYTANEEDVFAIAVRNDGDETVLHEYAHHFFYQHLNAPYPGWLSEGLAEYVMTARVREDEFTLGEPNEARVSWLNYGAWIPLNTLLSQRFGQVENGEYRATYYPVAWLLTHWFFSTPERSQQLDRYLRLVASGMGSSEAMTQATGLSMAQLDQTLTGYGRGNVYASTYPIAYRPIEVEITRMPASARDLILLGQRIKLTQTEELRQEALAEIRRRAARWPDDAFAQLILGHAELHIGDAAVGETTLMRVLELDPDNDEALQFLATSRIRKAGEVEDLEERRSLMAQARGFLARAYRIDPDDYFTLLLIARSRQGQPGYPNENDMLTWEAAFDGAPQLAEIRLGYGGALMSVGRVGEALGVLTPLANSPHGGTAADAARAIIAQALGGAPAADAAAPEGEAAPVAADQAG